ncbi:MAG: glycosyltransferase family 39 protein [Desulfobacterota bacterium]|nr:glycosyltransferase family 39 protein [Thermodesulfobacteriota bacterium]
MHMQRSLFVCGFCVFIATLFCLALTCGDIGWTWDEVYYFLSSELQIEWFRALKNSAFSGSLQHVLSQQVLDAYWLWDASHNPHPPLYKIFSSISLAMLGKYMDELVAYRMATAVLAAGLVALVFVVMAETSGIAVGLFAGLSLLVMPLFFGHAHIAATELPLAFFWFATYWAFWKGLRTAWGSLLLSILFGGALATKFTAVLIPAAMVLWALMYREKRALRNIIALGGAPCFAVMFTPGWWHQPLQKIAAFVQTSISRHDTTPISSFFMGERYVFSPPWYYSPVMTVITIPAAILFMMLIGSIFVARYRNQRDMLFVLNIPCILGAVMLPRAPVHDGIRQFFAVLPFCAYLSGLGFQALWIVVSRLFFPVRMKQTLMACAALLCLASAGIQVYRYHPFCLSYYNELIGGLAGAYERGMEVTYWFDAVNQPFLDQINRMVPDGARICIWPSNPEYFQFLQSKGKLKQSFVFYTPGRVPQSHQEMVPDYYILLHRRSAFREEHKKILATCRPLAVNVCDGVPLVLLYRW